MKAVKSPVCGSVSTNWAHALQCALYRLYVLRSRLVTPARASIPCSQATLSLLGA